MYYEFAVGLSNELAFVLVECPSYSGRPGLFCKLRGG
jgi:hypothetical protein